MGTDKLNGIEAVAGSSFADWIKGDKGANSIAGGAGDDTIRGLGGSDKLAGGEGRDTFVWHLKDVVSGGKHQGVDTVVDFSKEDVLDFSKLLAGQKWESIDEVLAIKSDGANSYVYAMLEGAWVEVVTLEGFAGPSASDMLKDGMILT
jgi:Ca2+-binding RTX toxin-like protein